MTKDELMLGLKDLSTLESKIKTVLSKSSSKAISKELKLYSQEPTKLFKKNVKNSLEEVELSTYKLFRDAKYVLRNSSDKKLPLSSIFDSELNHVGNPEKLSDKDILNKLAKPFKDELAKSLSKLTMFYYPHQMNAVYDSCSKNISKKANSLLSDPKYFSKENKINLKVQKLVLNKQISKLDESYSKIKTIFDTDRRIGNKGNSSINDLLNALSFSSNIPIPYADSDIKSVKDKLNGPLKKYSDNQLTSKFKLSKKIVGAFSDLELSEQVFSDLMYYADDLPNLFKKIVSNYKNYREISKDFCSKKTDLARLDGLYVGAMLHPEKSVEFFEIVSLYDSFSQLDKMMKINLESSIKYPIPYKRFNEIKSLFSDKETMKKALNKSDLEVSSFAGTFKYYENNPEELKELYSSRFKAKEGVSSISDLKNQDLYGVLVVGSRLLDSREDDDAFLDEFQKDYSQKVKPHQNKGSRSPSFGIYN